MSNGHQDDDLLLNNMLRQLGTVQDPRSATSPGTIIGQGDENEALISLMLQDPGLGGSRAGSDDRGTFERVRDWAQAIDPLINPLKGGSSLLPLSVGADLFFGWGKQGARLGEFGVGFLEGSFKTAGNIIALPDAALDALAREDIDTPLVTTASEWLHNSARAMEAAAEKVRGGAGLTDEEAKALNSFGELAGYVAPALASWKAAGMILGRTPAILKGDLIQDITAGAIFGLTTTEGTLQERAKNALLEIGFAGAFGAMLGGPRVAMRAYRLMNLAGDTQTRDLMKKIATTKDPLTGLLTLSGITKAQAKVLNRYLSEETFLTQTSGGVAALSQTADKRAAVAAIMEVAEGGSTHGVLYDIQNMSQTMQSIRDEFPALTVRGLPTGENKGIIIFGRGDIGADRIKTFSQMRRLHGDEKAMFPGQRFLRGDTEYIFVSPRGTKQVNALELGSGKQVFFEPEGITPLFTARPDLPTDIPTALVDNYIDWFEQNLDRLSQARQGMTDEQLARQLREGTLQIKPKRDWVKADGAVVDPEEVGIHAVPETNTEAFERVVHEEATSSLPPEVIGEIVPDVVTDVQMRGGRSSIPPPDEMWRLTIERSKEGSAAHVINSIEPPPGIDPFKYRIWLNDLYGFHGSRLSPDIIHRLRQTNKQEIVEAAISDLQRVGRETTVIDGPYRAKIFGRPTNETLQELQRRDPTEYQRILDRAQAEAEGAAAAQATVRPLDPIEPIDHALGVELWAQELGLKGSRSRLDAPADMLQRPQTRIEQGIHFLDSAPEGTVVGEWTKTDAQLQRWERSMGGVRTETKGSHEVLGRTGVQRVLDQFASPTTSLRPADLDAFKALAERRWLQRQWERLPREEREALERLQKEVDEHMAANVDNLDHIAAARGFHAHELENGTVLLRDINSGTPLLYETREAAMEGVLLSARHPDDFLKNMGVPTGSFSAGFQGRGASPDYSPIEWLDPGDAGGGGLRSAVGRALHLITHKPIFRNQLDWLREIEEGTGLRVWSNGVVPLLEGLNRYENRLRPFVNRLDQIFDGYKTPEILNMYEYIRKVEGQTLDDAAKRAVAKQHNLGARELRTIKQMRDLFDEGFRVAVNELGLSPRNYIVDYISKIQPLFERYGTVSDDLINQVFGGKLTPKDEAFFTKLRTHNLSSTEKDLRLITAKYFRELMFDAEVKPIWDQMYKMVERHYFPKGQRTQAMNVFDVYKDPLGMSALPNDAARAEAVKRLGGEQGMSTVLAVWEEILMGVKGQPAADTSMVSNAVSGLMGKLGVKIDAEVIRTFSNLAMSNVYGATMGLRPRTVIRDFYQNWWNLYTRLGGKDANTALSRAMTFEGFKEALAAGAVRPSQKGVFGADLAFDRLVDRLPVEGEGLVGKAVAGGLKRVFNAGKAGRKASEKFLIPFSSQDEMLRAWAYHWQKQHTQRFAGRIRQAEAGSKLERQLLDDALPFYGQATKQEFVRRLRGMGDEEALRFIGRQAADETNFVYASWAQPGWLQTSWGRMAGTFSTWPMWQIELYWRRIRNGTAKQRSAFVARTAAMTAAVGVLGYTTYTNLHSWLSPVQWLGYAGGPAIDVAIDLHDMWSEPWNRKAGAAERIASNVSRLSVPGIGFFWDAHSAVTKSQTPEHMLYTMMLGRGQEVDSNYAFQYIMNPNQALVKASLKNARMLANEREKVMNDLTTPEAIKTQLRFIPPEQTMQGQLRRLQQQPATGAATPGQ